MDVIPAGFITDELEALATAATGLLGTDAETVKRLTVERSRYVLDTIGDHVSHDGTCHWTGDVDDVAEISGPFNDPFDGPSFRWKCPLCGTEHVETRD